MQINCALWLEVCAMTSVGEILPAFKFSILTYVLFQATAPSPIYGKGLWSLWELTGTTRRAQSRCSISSLKVRNSFHDSPSLIFQFRRENWHLRVWPRRTGFGVYQRDHRWPPVKGGRQISLSWTRFDIQSFENINKLWILFFNLHYWYDLSY